MAQIVIFAPPGEDVSAGEAALKDAGHDVAIVDATATNLLHMAVGMMDEASPSKPEEPEEPEAPVKPKAPEETDPLAEPAEELPATTEGLFQSGFILVDGEKIKSYVDISSNKSQLRSNRYSDSNGKVSYSINENDYSYWKGGVISLTISNEKNTYIDHHPVILPAPPSVAPYIILGQPAAKALGIL